MVESKAPTHRAYATKREGQNVRWLEIGVATMHSDGNGCDIYLDRLPVGGFNGHILVRATDERPQQLPSEHPAESL